MFNIDFNTKDMYEDYENFNYDSYYDCNSEASCYENYHDFVVSSKKY